MLSKMLCLAALSPTIAGFFNHQDAVEKALAKAKDAWMSTAEKEERKIVQALEQQLEAVRKRAQDLGRYDEIAAELESFLGGDGSLPEKSAPYAVMGYRNRMLRANLEVDRAFAEAKRARLAANEATAAREIAAEQQEFREGEMARAWKRLLGGELLANGGAEEGEPAGSWRIEEGTWSAGRAHGEPSEGRAFFFPGPSSRAAMSQVIALQSYQYLIDDQVLDLDVAAAMRSYPQKPGDNTRVQVEFLDARGEAISGGLDSGARCSKSGWEQVVHTCRVPRGARQAVLRLESIRRGAKTQKNNDGYFDGLSLRLRLAQ
jgi:hypothetical protein